APGVHAGTDTLTFVAHAARRSPGAEGLHHAVALISDGLRGRRGGGGGSDQAEKGGDNEDSERGHGEWSLQLRRTHAPTRPIGSFAAGLREYRPPFSATRRARTARRSP